MTGRFAPSPSGDFHLGNVRTYVLAWLAEQTEASGRMLYRIEDIDRQRSHSEYAEQQMRDLTALGLTWLDEPVVQSQRTAIYASALAFLQANGHVFECYCSRRDLAEATRAPHGGSGAEAFAAQDVTRAAHGGSAGEGLAPCDHPVAILPPPPGFYPGLCRNLDVASRAELRAALAAQGREPHLRLRVPAELSSAPGGSTGENGAVAAGQATGLTNHAPTAPGGDSDGTEPSHPGPVWTFTEEMCIPGQTGGDPQPLAPRELAGIVDECVLRRGDGNWSYNFVATVDDLLMGVDHIVRGDDLLTTSPTQNYLATLLYPWAVEYAREHDQHPAAATEPVHPSTWRYMHVPLVMAQRPDGNHARLAKRDGAVTVGELGIAATWGWVAESLGYPGCASPQALHEVFRWENFPRTPVLWRPPS